MLAGFINMSLINFPNSGVVTTSVVQSALEACLYENLTTEMTPNQWTTLLVVKLLISITNKTRIHVIGMFMILFYHRNHALILMHVGIDQGLINL